MIIFDKSFFTFPPNFKVVEFNVTKICNVQSRVSERLVAAVGMKIIHLFL